jgi:hypothetical protein
MSADASRTLLDAAIEREAKLKHALQFAFATELLPDDPRVQAAADVEAARAAPRTLDELDEGTSSSN